jgi:protein ImuA
MEIDQHLRGGGLALGALHEVAGNGHGAINGAAAALFTAGIAARTRGKVLWSSGRLQLAAEGSGAIGLAIRRWRRPAEAADFGQPTASITRWRISALPSTPLPVPGVGRPRWQLELIRCRAGESADFEVEACDAKGRLALPSGLVHGPAEKDIGRRRASG